MAIRTALQLFKYSINNTKKYRPISESSNKPELLGKKWQSRFSITVYKFEENEKFKKQVVWFICIFVHNEGEMTRSIHSFFSTYPGLGCRGSNLSTFLSPNTLSSSSGGIPRHYPASPETVPPACPWFFPRAPYRSPLPWTPHQGGGIPIKCLSHLIWLFSMQSSSGSTPSSSQMAELFTLTLRISIRNIYTGLPAAIPDKLLPLFPLNRVVRSGYEIDFDTYKQWCTFSNELLSSPKHLFP